MLKKLSVFVLAAVVVMSLLPSMTVSADSPSYIWFEAEDGKAFTLSYTGGGAPANVKLSYCVTPDGNPTSWNEWTTSDTLSAASGEKIYVRATASKSNHCSVSSEENHFALGGESEAIACHGDVRGLINADIKEAVGGSNYFTYLFAGCTKLVTSPDLLFETLALGIYQNMFEGCTSLRETPALPATVLPDNCYKFMFKGCTSLKKPADLSHVTSVAAYCCGWMYSGCTGFEVCTKTGADNLNNPWTVPNATDSSWGMWAMGMFYGNTGDAGAQPSLNTTYYICPVKTNLPAAGLTTAPTAISGLVYSSDAQTLVTAGLTEEGTLQYALGTDSVTKPTEGWSDSLPQKTEAGTYYVWYYVKGDDNHKDSEASCLTVSIGKTTLTIGSAEIAEKLYDGTKTAEVSSVVFANLKGGETLTPGVDYTVSGEFMSADPGSDISVTVTVTLLDTEKTVNYQIGGSTQAGGNILSIPVAKPEHAEVSKGESVKFYVMETEEDADLSFQWYIDRQDGSGWVGLSGANLSSYQIAEAELENNGYEYYCEVTYPSGIKAKSNTTLLNVSENPPKTGDHRSILLWSVLGACSICVILMTALRKRKTGR